LVYRSLLRNICYGAPGPAYDGHPSPRFRTRAHCSNILRPVTLDLVILD
jgi:hypothetical protein